MTSLDTDTNFWVKYSTEQRNLTKPQNEVLLYFRIDSKRCPQSVEPDHRSDYNTHPHFHTALLSTLDDKWTLHFRAGLFHPEAAPCCALNKAHQFTACEQMTQVIVILQGKLGGGREDTTLHVTCSGKECREHSQRPADPLLLLLSTLHHHGLCYCSDKEGSV